MATLRDLITGDRGLLPYLQATFGTNWNNFQVRRVKGDALQGFRATSDRLEVMGHLETSGILTQNVVLGYIVEFPGSDGVEAQMVAAEFRDTLDRTILEWVERRQGLVSGDVQSISGVMNFQQATGQAKGWVITVVRELEIPYVTR